jgi:hypothetical protein
VNFSFQLFYFSTPTFTFDSFKINIAFLY